MLLGVMSRSFEPFLLAICEVFEWELGVAYSVDFLGVFRHLVSVNNTLIWYVEQLENKFGL